MPEMKDVCATCGKTYGKHYLTNKRDCDYPATGRIFVAQSDAVQFKVGDRVRSTKINQVGTIISVGDILLHLRLDNYEYDSPDDYHYGSMSEFELLTTPNVMVEKICKNKWCGAKNYLDAKICWKCETVRPAS